MVRRPDPGYATAAGITTVLVWAGSPVATKLAATWMSGLSVGVLRSMLAGIVALAIVVFARLRAPSSPRQWMLLLVSGLTSFAIWPAMAGIGIAYTSASHAGIIVATIPLFTVLLVHALQSQLPKPGFWYGAVIAFGATALLLASQPGGTDTHDGASLKGDLILIVGGAICAVGYVSGGMLAEHIGTIATTFRGVATALLLLVPTFVLIAGDTSWSAVALPGWIGIGWLTLLSSLAGYGLWFYALSKGDAARIGSLQLASPAATVAGAAIVLGEPITFRIVSILAIIVLGTWWARKHSAVQAPRRA